MSVEGFEAMRAAIAREFDRRRTFFVMGSGRTGSTSCIRILGTASNAETFSEPRPNLAVEIRRSLLGDPEMRDPRPAIWAARIDSIRQVLARGKIYGEKDLKFFAWLPCLRDLFNPRFVFVLRDGRDVVRSLMNWHYQIHGNLYREAGDEARLSTQARERVAGLPLEKDLVEQGRPRPLPEDPCFERWPSMSRFEMFAWYWAHVTRVAQRDLWAMEPDRWVTIDYTTCPSPDDFKRLFLFLQLEGFDASRVGGLIDGRVNSVEGKSRQTEYSFPKWADWSEKEMAQFNDLAASAMVQFGHYGIDRLPPVQGAHSSGAEVSRMEPGRVHEAAARSAVKELGPLLREGRRVLLIGPRPGGVDIPELVHYAGGALDALPRGEFSAVLVLGAIDRCGDMDRLLVEAAARARGGLFISASRGHFRERIEHDYRWLAGGEGAHAWAPAKAHSLLARALGFKAVRSGAVRTDDLRIPQVSFVAAFREPSEGGERL